MKIAVCSNIEIPFCYMEKAYLEEANTKRKSSCVSTFRKPTHDRKKERI